MEPTNSFLDSQYFNPDYLFVKGLAFFEKLFNFSFSPEVAKGLHILFSVLALFFITVICYTAVRMFEIRKKEHAHLHHELEEYKHHQAKMHEEQAKKGGEQRNPRWASVLEYLHSESAGDWKLAILEADSMLETMLDSMGFKGESLGDKLKSANQDTFKNLPAAWEVHNVRNQIAHEAGFQLSKKEANRVVALYEQIFRDYGFI